MQPLIPLLYTLSSGFIQKPLWVLCYPFVEVRPSLTCSVNNDAFFYLFVRKHLEDVHQLVIEVDQRVKKRSYNRKNESSLDPVTGEVKNQQQRRPLSQNFISKHKEGKNNICQVCAKGFKSAQQLGRHMLIHTGEKPYQVSCWLQLV